MLKSTSYNHPIKLTRRKEYGREFLHFSLAIIKKNIENINPLPKVNSINAPVLERIWQDGWIDSFAAREIC